MTRLGRAYRTALVFGTALTMLGAAVAIAGTPVSAATTTTVVTQGTATASTGRLVLEPTERGYLGDQSITVRNTGTRTGYFRLIFREPVAGSFETSDPDQFCQALGAETKGIRLTYDCYLNAIEPGQELTFQLRFRVLTDTRAYAMRATGGRIAIDEDVLTAGPHSDYAPFNTLFRSTTGSVRNPVGYVQDTSYDSSIVLHTDEVVLTRQPDGWYRGRLPVTVRYGTDAPHSHLSLAAPVADGLAIFWATDPAGAPCWVTCEPPGEIRFMKGEERSFALLFEAGPDSVPGTVREATVSVAPQWHESLPETDPADNVRTVRFRIADDA
ncbi:hypothetical protein [Micromonospora sp. IBHARD004]|uniref:hypothetical protein n=1 Tax=Micromonospora sp. IBHARD004 TaxID=3457764 RepID=UPI004057E7D3